MIIEAMLKVERGNCAREFLNKQKKYNNEQRQTRRRKCITHR